jgi:hypothetical protein
MQLYAPYEEKAAPLKGSRLNFTAPPARLDYSFACGNAGACKLATIRPWTILIFASRPLTRTLTIGPKRRAP